MDKKYYFIVVEGLSGTGKTIVATELAKILNASYIKTPISPINLIREKVDAEMGAAAKFLYYLSGIQHLSEQLQNTLKSQSVVCDKYIYSVLAFTRVKEPSLELPQFISLLEPDLKLLITVPEAVRHQRIESRDGKKINQDKIIRDRETEKIFKTFNFIEVDNSNNFETTINKIKEHLIARKILN